MRQLPSPEFRKSYPRLTEPVEVTALGRVIGRWVPAFIVEVTDRVLDLGESKARPTSVKVPQAERDRILRRINKS